MKMSYETLLEKAHQLIDSMSEERLENFVIHYDTDFSVKAEHPLLQMAGLLSPEEAQELRNEKLHFSGGV